MFSEPGGSLRLVDFGFSRLLDDGKKHYLDDRRMN